MAVQVHVEAAFATHAVVMSAERWFYQVIVPCTGDTP
jgi:hypothetical protein